jgi:hypothetical protein
VQSRTPKRAAISGASPTVRLASEMPHDVCLTDGADQSHAGGRDPSIRISDSDRDAVAKALGRYAAEGRLTFAELEARIDTVYAARTYGELSPLLADLPQTSEVNRLGTAKARSERRQGRRVGKGVSYVMASGMFWAIWGISVATSSHHNLDGLWPLWLTVPWGFALLRRRPACSRREEPRPSLRRPAGTCSLHSAPR